MKKATITCYGDLQKFVYDCGLDKKVAQLRWGKWFETQQKANEYLDANGSFEIVFNNNEIYAEWETEFNQN